jgi:hypothetical protein
MLKRIKILTTIGVVLIVAMMAAIVTSMTMASISNIAGRESFISAFGGAAFAYLFVRLGELFNSVRNSEKLNSDTIVSIEYVLNHHLNGINDDLQIIDHTVKGLRMPDVTFISFSRLKMLNTREMRLQDLRNIDFINDASAYFSQLQRIDDNANSLQIALDQLRDDAIKIPRKVTQDGKTFVDAAHKIVYDENAEQIALQLLEVKKQYIDQYENLKDLLAKVRYLYSRPSVWLSLPLPWDSVRHYEPDFQEKNLSSFRKAVDDDIELATEQYKPRYNSQKTKKHTKRS